jgi:hypothetical protein
MRRAKLIAFGKLLIIFIAPLFIVWWIRSDMIIAYLTFWAVIIALFKENMQKFFLPPILDISLAEPPLFYGIVDGINPNTGQFVTKQASMGIILNNLGLSRAKNVMVYFNGLESNIVSNISRYKSLPLIRSWSRKETIINYLPPNVPVRFSIGAIDQNQGDVINFEFPVRPNALIGIKCPQGQASNFKFEIIAVSDNADISRVIIEIEFYGTYTTDLKLKISTP